MLVTPRSASTGDPTGLLVDALRNIPYRGGNKEGDMKRTGLFLAVLLIVAGCGNSDKGMGPAVEEQAAKDLETAQEKDARQWWAEHQILDEWRYIGTYHRGIVFTDDGRWYQTYEEKSKLTGAGTWSIQPGGTKLVLSVTAGKFEFLDGLHRAVELRHSMVRQALG
jgi:hypothetical protein